MTKRRVESGRGESTVKAKARKTPKPAHTSSARAPKKATVKPADAAPLAIAAPPAPTVLETVALPVVETAPAKPRMASEPKKATVKAKVRKAPKLPALAPAATIAAPAIADAAISVPPVPADSKHEVPSPIVEPVPMTATIEPAAEAAPESPQPPIDVVSPVPALAAPEVTAEAAAFEEIPEIAPPIEILASVDETIASPSEQSATTGDDDGTATPVLETILVSVTKGNPFFKGPPTFVQEGLDAMVDSSSAASAGLEALGQEIAEFGMRRFDEAFAAWKGLMQARSPVERFQSQCDYARSALDDILGESSKVTLAMIKLAGEVSQPVTRRLAGSIDWNSR